MASKLLTKTKFLNGLKCHRLLWMLSNQPEDLPAVDIGTQHIFDQGQEVDELAKKLYPNGIDVSGDSFTSNIHKTREYLDSGRPLFQAGFKAANLYSRVDVLVPDGNNGWELVEVKSSHDGIDVVYYDPEGNVINQGFKKKYLTSLKKRGKDIIYLGDGLSDLEAARQADYVFATGHLLDLLDTYSIERSAFSDFYDLLYRVRLLYGFLFSGKQIVT